MPRSIAREQDLLARSAPKRPSRLTSRRIGIHTSTAGGVHNAAERAYRLGCNTLQIFSSSPRQWAAYEISHPHCEEMLRLRANYDLKPLVIHNRVCAPNSVARDAAGRRTTLRRPLSD